MARILFCACIFVLFAPRTRGEEFQVSLKYVTWEKKDKNGKEQYWAPTNAQVLAALDVVAESGKRTRVKAQIGDRALEMKVSVRRSAGEEVCVNLVATSRHRTDIGEDVAEASSTVDLTIGKCSQLSSLGEPDETGKVLTNAAFIIRITKPEHGH